MTRFMVSTCGVFAEVATLDAVAPAWMLVATGVTVGLAVLSWCTAAVPVLDRLAGLDIDASPADAHI